MKNVYSVLPKTCITLQFILGARVQQITGLNTPLPNHKLLREDQVFLYPGIYAKIYFDTNKSFQLLKKLKRHYNALVFTYYYGRLLSSSYEQTCNQSHDCQFKMLNISRTNNGHLQVHFPGALKFQYIVTRVVEQPVEIDSVSSSFSAFTFKRITEYSWTSSTTYHINCTSHYSDTANWSHLTLNLIKETCMNESEEKSAQLLPNKLSYILRPPGTDTTFGQSSHLWSLFLSVEGLEKVSLKNADLGQIVSTTYPVSKNCNKTKMIPKSNELAIHILYQSTKCVSIKTIANLSTSLLSTENQIEIGLQLFDDVEINFNLKANLTQYTDILQLIYKWKAPEFDSSKESLYHENYKILRYNSTHHSWTMAEDECSQQNMTLPYLENKKETISLIHFLLEFSILPFHLIFVGLIRKVTVIILSNLSLY